MLYSNFPPPSVSPFTALDSSLFKVGGEESATCTQSPSGTLRSDGDFPSRTRRPVGDSPSGAFLKPGGVFAGFSLPPSTVFTWFSYNTGDPGFWFCSPGAPVPSFSDPPRSFSLPGFPSASCFKLPELELVEMLLLGERFGVTGLLEALPRLLRDSLRWRWCFLLESELLYPELGLIGPDLLPDFFSMSVLCEGELDLWA